MSDKAGIVPRLAAYQAVEHWQENKGFITESFDASITGQDRGIAMTLALGICRNKSLLDYNLKQHVKFLPRREVQWVLWIGLYQIYEQEHFPIHVALDLSVELAKKLGFKKEVPMINGVLRKVQRDGFKVLRHSKKLKDIATAYSHPSYLVHKWHEELGFDKMIRRCRTNNIEAANWYRFNPQKIKQEEIENEFSPTEWRFDRYFQTEVALSAMLKHPFFKEGKFSIQDPASMLMISLLDIQKEDKVLDLCGAPGGKSALILEDNPGVTLVLGDLKWERLHKSHDLKTRLGLDFTGVVADARALPYKSASFNKVLVDAPCSNLGVINKRPEARWNASKAELDKQGEVQYSILTKASEMVSPGGTLVYGTCSPEPEETDAVVIKFLENHPEFKLETARKWVHRRFTSGSYLKIIPQPGSIDGFFGARLVKEA
jgi:16S rRNA (cytosine967-C5)-methyltransferase